MAGRPLVPLLLLALGLAGCGRERPREAPAPEPAGRQAPAADHADRASEGTRRCVNEVIGYTVEYPAGWHTNPGEVLGPCSIFHPDPVTIPPATELRPDIAIRIHFERQRFATIAGPVIGRRELKRERVTVGGREAIRVENETTGEGLYDHGIRAYEYFVDLGDRTMLASTYSAGPVPFERKRVILDAMMSSLRFRDPPP